MTLIEHTRSPGLLRLIAEDLRCHPEGLLGQGFWALCVYRIGHARYRYRSKWVRLPWGGVHAILSKLVEMTCGISIGVKARIGRRVVIWHFGGIVIHGEASIGDDSVIRQGVTIGNRHLDRPHEAPCIGQRVNIGAGAKILGAVRIGDGAAIGANAVVVCDIPAGTTAVGVPAKVVKMKDVK